jgi:predicted ATPase/DNA-binding CsgD family transcriptional regulator
MPVASSTAGIESAGGVPVYLTSFVGRSRELAELGRLVRAYRLVTLTGPGGIGKTRLAAELASAGTKQWPNGAWWADLSSIGDGDKIAATVLAALHLQAGVAPLDAITSWFGSKSALLVLDSCEHLLATSADLCHAVLSRCRGLTIIATSREPLGVDGEARWPVPALAGPDAIHLFEERARLATPGYRLTDTTRTEVAEICRRIDELPLAIELVASRVDVFGEQEILTQLSSPLRVMSGGSRTGPSRHQTMAATIEWSYGLLTPDEARLFRRLSVFRGGFDLDSAQAVCGDGPSTDLVEPLAGLVEKSMVLSERAHDGQTRYRLLESQIAFGETKLRDSPELEDLRRRHYEHFLDAIKSRTRPWVGPRSALVTGPAEERWKQQERANLWAALRWARHGASDLGLSLAAEVADIQAGDVGATRAWLAELLEHSPEQGEARLLATWEATYLAFKQGDAEAILRLGRELEERGSTIGDTEWIAIGVDAVATGLDLKGRLEEAEAGHQRAVDLVRGSTNSRLRAAFQNSLACTALAQGRFELARAVMRESVASMAAAHDWGRSGACLETLANAELGCGDALAAERTWKESLTVSRDLGDAGAWLTSVGGLARTATALGNHARSLRLTSAHHRLCVELSFRDPPFWREELDRNEQISRAALGPAQSDGAWEQGTGLSLQEVLEYALAETRPATAATIGPLSRREVEVASLVARGMTNREIGLRLFISERTAEGHVERIRGKLGARSRTEVATWAINRGLLDEQHEKGTLPGPLSRTRKQLR